VTEIDFNELVFDATTTTPAISAPQGNSAIVHKARWHTIDVAVKQLRHDTAAADNTNGPRASALRDEALRLLKAIACPLVVRVLGVTAHAPGAPSMLVTEWIAGGETLLSATSRRNSFNRLVFGPIFVALLRQVAAALAFLHRRVGVRHGDVAARNVMLRVGRLEAVLIDFGLTRPLFARRADSVPLDNIAPELNAAGLPRNEDAAGKADVYSFGWLLFECATGTPRSRDSHAAHRAALTAANTNGEIVALFDRSTLADWEVRPSAAEAEACLAHLHTRLLAPPDDDDDDDDDAPLAVAHKRSLDTDAPPAARRPRRDLAWIDLLRRTVDRLSSRTIGWRCAISFASMERRNREFGALS